MKKIPILLISIFMLIFLTSADHFMTPTARYSDIGFINYSGTVTGWLGDSVGAYHTKPFKIGNCNAVDAYIQTSITTGYDSDTDIDVTYHYSNNLTEWVQYSATADADMQLNANQYQVDTVGIHDGTNDNYFHSFTWMIIEFTGQDVNGNDDAVDQVLKWNIQFIPDIVAVSSNGAALQMAAVASRANSNP